jgi:hypothetical protein
MRHLHAGNRNRQHQSNRRMKKHQFYEAIGITLAMPGAVLLVAVFYPLINPIQYQLDSHGNHPPLSRYVIGTLISLLLVAAGWHYNRRAQKLKRKDP